MTTTTAPATLRITDHQLRDLLTPIAPHMSPDPDLPAIRLIRLEAGGGYLHAVATNRYTLAVARVHINPDVTWHGSLRADDVDEILGTVDNLDLPAELTQTYTRPAMLRLCLSDGVLRIDALDGLDLIADNHPLAGRTYDATVFSRFAYWADTEASPWPALDHPWRTMLAAALKTPRRRGVDRALKGDLLACWQGFDRVEFWSPDASVRPETAASQLVITGGPTSGHTGVDLIGLQLAMRDMGPDTPPDWNDITTIWAESPESEAAQ